MTVLETAPMQPALSALVLEGGLQEGGQVERCSLVGCALKKPGGGVLQRAETGLFSEKEAERFQPSEAKNGNFMSATGRQPEPSSFLHVVALMTSRLFVH